MIGWLNRISISRKLWLAGLLMITLGAVGGAVALLQLLGVQQNIDKIVQQSQPAAFLANRWNAMWWRVGPMWGSIFLAKSRTINRAIATR